MAKNFGASNNNTLKKIGEKSKQLSDTNMVVMLPITKIKDNKDNEYLFGMKQEDIEYTAQGIKDNGFKGAIEVYDLGDGTYQLFSGHIRKYAQIKNHEELIPALVYKLPSETQQRRDLLGANLFGRKNKLDTSNPILVGRQIEYHKETLKMEGYSGNVRAELSREFGISEGMVHNYLSLLELNPELQKKVENGEVAVSAIAKASTLDAEQQNQLVTTIDNNKDSDISREDIKELITQIKEEEPVLDENGVVVRDVIPDTKQGKKMSKIMDGIINLLENTDEKPIIYENIEQSLDNYRYLKGLIDDEIARLTDLTNF